MNKSMKKVTALVLTLALVMGVVIVPSYADNEDQTALINADGDVELSIKQVDSNGNVVEIGAGDSIRFEDPFSISLKFSVPEEDGELKIFPGDYAYFEVSDDLVLQGPTPIPMKSILTKSDGTIVDIKVAEAKIESKDGKSYLKITFDNYEESVAHVFGALSDFSEVNCEFAADFKYEGLKIDDGDEKNDVIILDKKFTFAPTLPDFEITKSGTIKGDKIEWEVEIKAEKKLSPPEEGSLKGIIFHDDLSSVGDYVAGTFQATGDGSAGVFTPAADNKSIKYEFHDDATGTHTLKFETEMPEDVLFNGGSVENTAKIYDEDPSLSVDPIDTSTKKVTVPPPTWITKTGSVNKPQNAATYDPTSRTITWEITINEIGADLKNVKIIDSIPSGLTYVSSELSKKTGGTWGAYVSFPPESDNKTYDIGNIDGPAKLKIVASVPDEDFKLGETPYTNTARIESDKIKGQNSNGSGITIGYPGFTKSGVSDLQEGTIKWTLELDPKNQPLNDIVIYDLFVYGSSTINLAGLTVDSSPYGDPGGPAFPTATLSSLGLEQNLNMKFNDGYIQNTGHSSTKYSVYTLKDSTNKIVADLLIIAVENNNRHEFEFETKITNPEIYASNKSSSYRVPNTANLRFTIGGTPKKFDKEGTAVYHSNVITKDSLKRDWATPSGTGTATNSFDYKDKEVTYRLLVNKNNMNLTGAPPAGEGLTNITLKDTLELGWEFKNINMNDFHLYRTDSYGNATGSPIDSSSIVTMSVVQGTDTEEEVATFTFISLTESYVILLKAGPTEDAAKAFFENNKPMTAYKNIAAFYLNNAQLAYDDSTVRISSLLLDKKINTTKANSDGYLTWTLDYNPYDFDITDGSTDELALIDKLDSGLEFRTDSNGDLLIDGNVKAYKMKLEKDGSISVDSEITLTIGTNIFYDTDNRELRFIIEDHDVPYRLVYITDITGNPGENPSNRAMLTLKNIEHQGKQEGYLITDSSASATLTRGGNFTITKQDNSALALPGIEFVLYTEDQSRVIRNGVTDTSGKLTFRAIPAPGTYWLQEKYDSTLGYSEDDRFYRVEVTESSGIVTTEIENGSNQYTIINHLLGTVGDLRIEKEITGDKKNPADTFTFNITLTDGGSPASPLTGDYDYILVDSIGNKTNGVKTFAANGTALFTLLGGQKIIFKNLPKGSTYEVEENDPSGMGYSVNPSTRKLDGSIAADTVEDIKFTNNKDGWIEILKVNALTDLPLSGVQFTLYNDGSKTEVASGTTDSEGIARFLDLQDGTYYLRETKVPSGYEYHYGDKNIGDIEYEVVVTSGNAVFTDSGTHAIKLKNYQNGKVGDLIIKKTLSGNNTDSTKDFEFTLTMPSLANETFDYIGIGTPSGSFTFNAAGVYTFTLKGDQSIQIIYLPEGEDYEVVEADYSGDKYITTHSPLKGKITADDSSIVSFNNHKSKKVVPKTGTLMISKKVTGNAGDKSKKFTFTVTFSDKVQSFEYFGSLGNGTIKSGDKIQLAHGESITIVEIPDGVTYKIVEDDYTSDGYKHGPLSVKGTIEEDVMATAAFINDKHDEDIEEEGVLGDTDEKDPDKPGKPGDEDGDVLGDDARLPKTGDDFMPAVWVAGLIASLLGIWYVLRRRSSFGEE
jgi:uncharacterized repeat protein (TIGR01451 family)/LPXTG-motif cell wall-anchored protein